MADTEATLGQGRGPGRPVLRDHGTPRRAPGGVPAAAALLSAGQEEHGGLDGGAHGRGQVRPARGLQLPQGQAGVRPRAGGGPHLQRPRHLRAAHAVGPVRQPGDTRQPVRHPHRGFHRLRGAALPAGRAEPHPRAHARDRELRGQSGDGAHLGGGPGGHLRSGQHPEHHRHRQHHHLDRRSTTTTTTTPPHRPQPRRRPPPRPPRPGPRYPPTAPA